MEKNAFDVVISADVLEHIHADLVSELVGDIATILKPGGYSYHSIDLNDHLSYYDASASPKHYLQFSDRTWKRWFENEVQYINRLQRPQWLEAFRCAGLLLVEEQNISVDLSGLKVAMAYQQLDGADLCCSHLNLVHRKLP